LSKEAYIMADYIPVKDEVFLCGGWGIEREGEKDPFGDIEEAIIPQVYPPGKPSVGTVASCRRAHA
jgi:hypothetical protein